MSNQTKKQVVALTNERAASAVLNLLKMAVTLPDRLITPP